MEQKVDVNELHIGMYVSRLDRPWVDTPFLFQGFYINSIKDIESLKKSCMYIYVDTDKQPHVDDVLKVPAANDDEKDDEFSHKQIIYEDVCTVDKEIAMAKESRKQISGLLNNLIDDIGAGRKVSLAGSKKTVQSMVESIIRNPDACIWLSRLKDIDHYTYNHALDVSILAVALGRHLGFTRQELLDLAIGGLLIDIGKIKLPANLLNKPGRLTDDEFVEVKKHVEYGVDILKQIDGISDKTIEMVMYHHERHNGKGYPKKLKGARIPVFARIAAIVDCYDAITSNTTYHRAISSHEAVTQIYEWRDVDFQAQLVEQFIQCMGIYPTGSIVELSTGEIGVVMSQNRVRRLRPRIMLILDSLKVALESFPVVDLATETKTKDGAALSIINTHEPGSFGIDPATFYL